MPDADPHPQRPPAPEPPSQGLELSDSLEPHPLWPGFWRLRLLLPCLVLLALLPALGLVLQSGLAQREVAEEQGRELAQTLATRLGQHLREVIGTSQAYLTAVGESRNPGRAEVLSRLLATPTGPGVFYAALLSLDEAGQVVAAAGEADPKLHPQRQQAAILAYEQGRTLIRAFHGESAQTPGHLAFFYPLAGKSGPGVPRVVVAEFDLGELERLTSTLALPEKTTVVICNDQGVVLYREPEPAQWIGRIIPARQLGEGDTGAVTWTTDSRGMDGVERLYAFFRLDNQDGLEQPVYIRVGLAEATVFAHADRLLWRNLAGIVLIAVFVFVVSRLLCTSFILEPLASLLQAAERIASGDVKARSGLTYNRGEIGALGRAFDTMAQSLDQRQAEQTRIMTELAEREGRNRALVDASEDGVLLFTPDGAVLDCNTAAATRRGLTRDTLLGRSLYDGLPPAIAYARRQAVDQAVHEKRRMDYEEEFLGGTAAVTIMPIPGPKGDIALLASFARDVTALRQAEAHQQLLSAIVESSDDGIIGENLEGVVVSWNRGAEIIYGYTGEEMVGRRVMDILTPSQVVELQTGLERLRKGGRVERIETTRRRKDGRLIDVSLTLSPIVNRAGKILGFSVISRDISERKAMARRQWQMAYRDELTDLPNLAFLRERLAECLEAAQRQNRTSFALLRIDLERIRHIGDTLGREYGDQLLQAAAECLRQALPMESFAARLEGGEFAVLMRQLPGIRECITQTERLRRALQKRFAIRGQTIQLRPDIGIALGRPEHATPEDVLRDASLALERIRGKGGRIRVFDRTILKAARRRMTVESHLRRALGDDELFLDYQPIVETATGRQLGYEALMRWRSAELGIIPPVEFIPVAEDTGLILPMGEYALQRACLDMQISPERSLENRFVSVNVSAVQLADHKFPRFVEKMLLRTGLPANRLKLEITESFLVQNADVALHALSQLKDMGLTICIDDFGTGYSSLAYLARFPIDVLKIDGSFVRALDKSGEGARRLIQSIIQLGKGSHLQVVAEGVETVSQLGILRSLGCDMAQGYLFARPGPLEQVCRMARNPLPEPAAKSRRETTPS